MLRKIIQIDEDACNGCGLCANACHEGAIQIVEGKAKLMREDYCDGLGDCLPACPVHAISFVTREAAAYDAEAVANNKGKSKLPCGCPGSAAKQMEKKNGDLAKTPVPSQLGQWPVQLQLVPEQAPYFEDAEILVAADCTAYAYGAFHSEFIRNHITLIGCPKLDQTAYAEKLTRIFAGAAVRSVTVARMEVPCCGGIEHAVRQAIRNSGKAIPLRVVTIGTGGDILKEQRE